MNRSPLPPALRAPLEALLGATLVGAKTLGGGMVNQAARVDTSDGPVFVKWKPDAPPGFFDAEADGLARLRAARALRVPDVLAVADRDDASNALPFLVLEYIEPRPPSDPAQFARRFGEALAALHQNNTFVAYGLERDNYLGAWHQPNTPHARWTDFYRDRRLLPQIDRARAKGLLSLEREQRLMQLVERLETLLADLPGRPALIHGDLWSGNFLAVGDEPVLLDPAVYYGEREIEIAYMELFGGFPSGLLFAYRAAFPLDPGYERRRPLHQLYPLLVHLNHFGETYGPDVDHVCGLYVGG